MKVAFATLVVVGATLSSAIAVADPAADPIRSKLKGSKAYGWCGTQGVSCARDVATCGVPGNPCARLKRSAEAVADAFAVADPIRSKLKGSKAYGWCGTQGVSCAKARRSILEVGEAVEEAVTNIYAREADAAADPIRSKLKGSKAYGWCGTQGVSCARGLHSRRSAEADASAEPIRSGLKGSKAYGWCGTQGVSCAKAKRDADAAADPIRSKLKGSKAYGWCGTQGVSCAKAKRDAEAEADPIRSKLKGSKAYGWCGTQGVSCARDVTPEQAEAAVNAARSIDAVDPEFFKRIRDAEDGEGTALREAHAAFMNIKREAEAIAEEATPFELLSFCDQYDCTEDDVATIAARAAGTFDEREAEACNAPGGACDIAKRQLDDIEAKLTAAVEAL